jgi:signal transduction histidine kinase
MEISLSSTAIKRHDGPMESAVKRALLQLGLRNSGRSVPLLIAGILILTWQAADTGLSTLAAGSCVLGLFSAGWRYSVGRRIGDPLTASTTRLRRAVLELECNAAFSGIYWCLCTVALYPHLHTDGAVTYVALVFGSIAAASCFMPPTGCAFVVLSTLQLVPLIAVSLLSSSARSMPLAAMGIVFGGTMLQAAKVFKQTAIASARHAAEAEEANASLIMARDAAEAANVAKSQCLATMSHEIRTPMNGVLGSLDLLVRAELDAQSRRLVKTAVSSGRTLMAILNDALDYATIEAGALRMTPAPMSVPAAVKAVADLFRASADAKGLRLDLDIEPSVPHAVLADSQRLKQVLSNLVGNAIKFTETGAINVRVTADCTETHVRVAFYVEDSGIGMDAADLKGLFRPFHQVAAARSSRRKGTGLGLAISQRMVEAMGGTIRVSSTPGVGTQFGFALVFELVERPDTQPLADSGLAPMDTEPVPLRGTVLVVEDHPVNRLIACEMLRSLGVSVVEASDGSEALQLLFNTSVDLVLMDCEMPVMDGYTATQRIRDFENQRGLRRLPIIALTANASEHDEAKTRSVGMDAHIAKPYTRAELLETLLAFL